MNLKPTYREGYCLNDDLQVEHQVSAFVTDDFDTMLLEQAKSFNKNHPLHLKYKQVWGYGTHTLLLRDI